MKISNQLKSAAIGILAIGGSSLASVYLNSLGNDSKVVNSAGIVRGGTQRLVKLELAGKPSDKLIEKQDKLVYALINGDDSLDLPVATDIEFRKQMELVAIGWKDLKQKISIVRQNSQGRAELLDASEKYFELANQAVFAAETYSTNKATRLRTIQLVIFAASLLLLITIWMTVNTISKILETSTNDITRSSNHIAGVVVEQEKSILQQAAIVSKTTQIMSGLQDFTKQSFATNEQSVDRVNLSVELLKKLNKSTGRNLTDMSSLMEKLNTITTYLEMLDRQAIKIAKVAIPADRSRLVDAVSNREMDRTNVLDRSSVNSEEINELFINLQSSINAMILVTNDSRNILEINAKLSQENAIDLPKVIATFDYLSLDKQQTFTMSKQCMSAVEKVTTLMNQLNIGAQETTRSISQVGLSARQLTDTTKALQVKI